MKSIRSGLLVALVLVSAIVVVASPAFATPNITASSGTAAVSPFITPATNNTRSLSTALSTDSRFDLGGNSLTCRTANASFYIPPTHTQGRITSITFGRGRTGDCAVASGVGSGTIDGNSVSDPTTNSTTPSIVHVRTFAASSATGTINLSGALTFVVTIRGFASCQLTVPVQSVDVVYTQRTTSLVVSDRTVATTVRTISGFGCPASGDAVFTATYTVRADTPRDARLTVTNAS
jgi:hypothetical protein